MTTAILAAFPSPAQGVWYLGSVPIRAYALCIIVGIIVALVIGDRRWVARGGESGVVYDIALWAVPFGLVGGRLYHLITDWRTYFGEGGAGLDAALRIWDGGLGIWGAVALGGVGAWIGCRRRGIPLPAFGDAIAPGIVLAQAIGRLGNYFNQELYGRETTVPWGLEIFYRRDPSGIIDVHSLNGVSTGQVAAVVHPTFLYELLWNVLVFVVLIIVDRRFRIGHGRLFALYVALYCVGRFGVELLRDDAATHLAGIRINSFTATFVFLGAVVYMILARKGREDPASLRGDLGAEEGELLAPELLEELVAVAGATGVVAAATVAGREDVGEDESVTGESAQESQDSPESLSDADETDEADADETDEADADADAEGPFEDEALLEAEAVSPGVVTEAFDDEPELIDEDHDPLDGEDLEGQLPAPADRGPLSEQAEILEDTEEPAEVDEGDVADSEQPEELADADSAESADLDAGEGETGGEPGEPEQPEELADADSAESADLDAGEGETGGEPGEPEQPEELADADSAESADLDAGEGETGEEPGEPEELADADLDAGEGETGEEPEEPEEPADPDSEGSDESVEVGEAQAEDSEVDGDEVDGDTEATQPDTEDVLGDTEAGAAPETDAEDATRSGSRGPRGSLFGRLFGRRR